MARHIRNELHHHDPRFVKKVMPWFDLLEKYFRYEVHGIDRIPKNRGSIVVMNHGVIPYHGFLLCKKVIERHGIFPRGLGAGFLFSVPGLREFFLKGGAVNANPKNAAALIQAGNCLMLAPGGIYEALVSHPGMKRIPWERRMGFVRLAVETGAPIVPTYCAGINDVYFNSKFLLKLRIRLLEWTRVSFPLVLGLGLLPLPKKLIHAVGRPIVPRRRRGETVDRSVRRIHGEVLEALSSLSAQSSF